MQFLSTHDIPWTLFWQEFFFCIVLGYLVGNFLFSPDVFLNVWFANLIAQFFFFFPFYVYHVFFKTHFWQFLLWQYAVLETVLEFVVWDTD